MTQLTSGLEPERPPPDSPRPCQPPGSTHTAWGRGWGEQGRWSGREEAPLDRKVQRESEGPQAGRGATPAEDADPDAPPHTHAPTGRPPRIYASSRAPPTCPPPRIGTSSRARSMCPPPHICASSRARPTCPPPHVAAGPHVPAPLYLHVFRFPPPRTVRYTFTCLFPYICAFSRAHPHVPSRLPVLTPTCPPARLFQSSRATYSCRPRSERHDAP